MTAAAIYLGATLVVVAGAYLRGAGVILASLRTALARRRFVTFRVGWAELLCVPEPFVLLAVTAAAQAAGTAPASAVGLARFAGAVGGAGLVLGGLGLLLWSIASWPAMFVGHGILIDHRLIDRGAYAAVRHPAYLSAFLIWLGVALGLASAAALLITALYVVPAYLLYIRSEEAMMAQAFGDAYARYRERVPMLLPRLPRAAPPSRHPATRPC